MTPREIAFAEIYVANGHNAADAAAKAGYAKGFVQKRAYEILKRPDVKAEVERLEAKTERMRDRVEQQMARSAAEIIDRIGDLAMAQVLDYVKPDPNAPGNFIGKSPDELTPQQRAAVADFRVKPVYVDKKDPAKGIARYEYAYTLHDPPNALMMMGRHFGLFDDKLRLIGASDNRFKNLSTEQLAEVRQKIVEYMTNATGNALIEGEVNAQKMLPDDRGSGGSGGSAVGG